MNERAPYKKEFVKFIPYLNAIDITTRAYLKRIELIYTWCSDMCPEEIEDIFAEDYFKEDGTREYENLWFFSKNYCLEAKKFLTQINLDITPIKNRIHYWTVQAQDFDFKKASDKSRLNLRFDLAQRISGELKAARGNCDFLQAIINKYVKPNQVPL